MVISPVLMVISNLCKLIAILSLVLFIFSGASASENPDELYKKGKFAEAEKKYNELDMEHPGDVRFRYNRGCAAFQNSDFQGALAAFSSALRRTKDKKIRFRTLYNLGNTAFKLGNFESAADYYKQAIQLDPNDMNAAYNLELSLREIEKLEKKEEEEKKQQGEGEKQKGKSEKDTDTNSQSGESDKDEKGKQDESQGQKQQEGDKSRRESESQKDKDNARQDLSGELTPLDKAGAMKEGNEQAQSGSSLGRKRAEAMLDNINEDRSKFLRFQIPKDKRQGVQSGKDW